MRLHLLTPLWFENRRISRAYATHRRQRLWRQGLFILGLTILAYIVSAFLS